MRFIGNTLAFYGLLTLGDILFRQGLLVQFLPNPLSPPYSMLLWYSVFAAAAWKCTQFFGQRSGWRMADMGISMDSNNRRDFTYGFVAGVLLWGIVALVQAQVAGFSWVLRPAIPLGSLIHGLLFITIADLGTELYTRAYPLSQLQQGWHPLWAVIAVATLEWVKNMIYHGTVWDYAVIIPVLHVVFFGLIYLKTQRLGASLGMHIGANFITISIFDLREAQPDYAIPSGLFTSNIPVADLSMDALQIPWVAMATLIVLATYVWWRKSA